MLPRYCLLCLVFSAFCVDVFCGLSDQGVDDLVLRIHVPYGQSLRCVPPVFPCDACMSCHTFVSGNAGLHLHCPVYGRSVVVHQPVALTPPHRYCLCCAAARFLWCSCTDGQLASKFLAIEPV